MKIKPTKTNKTKSLRESRISTFKVNKLHSERKSISKEPINVSFKENIEVSAIWLLYVGNKDKIFSKLGDLKIVKCFRNDSP